jgi:hypothetical protein
MFIFCDADFNLLLDHNLRHRHRRRTTSFVFPTMKCFTLTTYHETRVEHQSTQQSLSKARSRNRRTLGVIASTQKIKGMSAGKTRLRKVNHDVVSPEIERISAVSSSDTGPSFQTCRHVTRRSFLLHRHIVIGDVIPAILGHDEDSCVLRAWDTSYDLRAIKHGPTALDP